MSQETVPVNVEIMDKEYMISCPADERESLIEAAGRLNERLRQVRDSGKVLGTERMAVITALNVIHELTQRERRDEEAARSLDEGVKRIAGKVERALAGRRVATESLD